MSTSLKFVDENLPSLKLNLYLLTSLFETQKRFPSYRFFDVESEVLLDLFLLFLEILEEWMDELRF